MMLLLSLSHRRMSTSQLQQQTLLVLALQPAAHMYIFVKMKSRGRKFCSRRCVLHKFFGFLVLLALVLPKHVADSYRAVAIIHGVLTGPDSMKMISDRIQEKHPGTQIYTTPRYAGWSSLEPLWRQVEEIGNDIISIGAAFPEGINLIGYSQGGLIARAILQRFPEHNVKNFISLSSPQAGQYGTRFLHLIFPDLACESAFELFYSRIGQHTSIGNFWNDPRHQELYFKYSRFLPFVNNEIITPNTTIYKEGLTKLNKMVLIGGPDDGVITPWQSSHFGYYDKNETVVDVRDRNEYKQDLIGLKTLDKSKKLLIHKVPGVSHFMWHANISVIDNYIIPYLD